MSEIVRVLQVIGAMDRGGAETMIMNLYRNIDKSKFQFDFMVHTTKKSAYDDEIRSLGGKIYHIPKFNGANFLEYYLAWKNFYRSHDEHSIVHGHIGSSAALYLSFAKKHGKIAVAHSHCTMLKKANIRDMLWKTYSYPTRFIADYFLACSEEAGIDRFGKRVMSGKNSFVLYNAIDTHKYIFSSADRDNIRDTLGLNNKFVVGHIGRHTPQKNPIFLLKLFAEIYKAEPNARLLQVGQGELTNQMKEECDKLGIADKVIFTGSRDNIPDLLSAMDVFVFPSLWEGLGIVAIEAQASGLQTICSDVIPKEARITDLFHALSLNLPLDEWVRYILQFADGYERKDMHDRITEAGYDIHQTARWLEEFYNEIVQR